MPAKASTIPQFTRDQFRSSDSGAMRGGIQWVIRTDLGAETHECYQYNTPEEISATVAGMITIPGMEKVAVVTYSSGYKNMKRLYEWSAT